MKKSKLKVFVYNTIITIIVAMIILGVGYVFCLFMSFLLNIVDNIHI